MIRFASEADIDRLAEIHGAALPEDFLPQLGRGFLKDVFFPSALRPGNAFVLVAEEQESVDAFVVFARDSAALTRDLRARPLRLAFAMLGAALRRPSFVSQVLAVIRGGRIELSAPVPDLTALPELYLIATDPGRQSRGLGGALVHEGLRLLAEKGNHACVVKTSSPRARSFYHALGFQQIGTEIRGGRVLWLLHRKL